MKKLIIPLLSLLILLQSCGNQGADTSEAVSGTNTNESEISAGEIPESVSRVDMSEMDFDFTDRDRKNGYDEDDVRQPDVTDSSIEITQEGVYILSGGINKAININAGENDKIQLVLDNASISNPNGPAIYIGEADKVFITALEGSQNSISDGENYSLSDEKSELDGAIFSRADLTINGSGSIAVNGNYKHGIVSKDDLVIVGTTLDVTSKNVALHGKDCVKIEDASITLTAGSDGIRSDNDEDAARGFVYIESGRLDITAENDGIQAETAIKIVTAEINIVSGGGSGASLSDSTESYKGIKAVSDVLILGGEFDIDSLDDAIHSNSTICIEGGSFDLSSGDDGIHADTDLAISNGSITVSKSYEGLESSRIFITGGNMDITASDDGLNAAGGNDASAETNPIAPDGMGGGMGGDIPPGGFGGGKPGFGHDAFDNGVGEIIISGGYICIDASGDGIDSNGSFNLSDGVVLVSGPTNNGNGAFDYGSEAKVTGGVLIAAGSAGMAQGFSAAENQGAIFSSFSYRSGGTNIAICDKNGNAIAVFTPKKDYQSVVITAPEIQSGNEYSLYAAIEIGDADENGFARNIAFSGGTLIADITMDSLIYGSGGFRPGGPGGGDHGGGPGGRR